MDARLRYSREELLESHDYARPHEEAGYKLHGGFLADGTYARRGSRCAGRRCGPGRRR